MGTLTCTVLLPKETATDSLSFRCAGKFLKTSTRQSTSGSRCTRPASSGWPSFPSSSGQTTTIREALTIQQREERVSVLVLAGK